MGDTVFENRFLGPNPNPLRIFEENLKGSGDYDGTSLLADPRGRSGRFSLTHICPSLASFLLHPLWMVLLSAQMLLLSNFHYALSSISPLIPVYLLTNKSCALFFFNNPL